jgi:hypothetical protein
LLPILQKIHEPGEYNPTLKDIRTWAGILNESCFNGVIPKFRHIKIQKISGQLAACDPMGWKNDDDIREANLQIDSSFPDFKSFIVILAHEMIHAWQWVIKGKMTHGKTFFQWKEKLLEQGIPLHKEYHRKKILDTEVVV